MLDIAQQVEKMALEHAPSDHPKVPRQKIGVLVANQDIRRTTVSVPKLFYQTKEGTCF